MDSIFDGTLFSYLIPIVLIVLFSLPDALRRKRKYPKRTKPAPQPESRRQTEERNTAPQPSPVPTAGRKLRPRVEPRQVRPPVQRDLPASVPAAAVTAAAPPVPPAAVHRTEEPWSRLPAPAKELYAGIIWSELLQPPLAYRRKKR